MEASPPLTSQFTATLKTQVLKLRLAASVSAGVLAERLGDLWAGPTRQRQQHGARPVGFSTISGAGQSHQGAALFVACRNRRLSRHATHLQIGADSESQNLSVGQPSGICLAPISGPFVATESFWSRLPAAVPSMRLGGRIDRPPRQALRARSHWDHALAARVATAR